MSVTPTVFTSSWKNLFKNLHRSLSFEITLSLSTRVILFIVVPLSNKKCFILWLFYMFCYILFVYFEAVIVLLSFFLIQFTTKIILFLV